LLAVMASVVLLIQLWMFSLARSHEERARAAPPAETERVGLEPRSPDEAMAEPLHEPRR
jgi:hypothetical protein